MMGGKWRSSVQPSLPKNYHLIYEIVEESGIGRHLTPSDIYAKALKRRPALASRPSIADSSACAISGWCPNSTCLASTRRRTSRRARGTRTSAAAQCGEIEDVAYAIPARTLKALACSTDSRSTANA